MDREILFRGKRVDNGEWVYGLLLVNKLGAYIITEENPHECTQYGYIEIDEYSRVDPETVGQKSGLKERPGTKDIWQGDIVKITLMDTIRDKPIISDTCLVEFRDGMFGVRWGNDEHFIPLAQFSPGTIIEVIGTIHDNPELLEV